MPDNMKLGTDESSEDHSRNGVFQNQPILRQSHYLRQNHHFIFVQSENVINVSDYEDKYWTVSP